jgi:hypothetical protein
MKFPVPPAVVLTILATIVVVAVGVFLNPSRSDQPSAERTKAQTDKQRPRETSIAPEKIQTLYEPSKDNRGKAPPFYQATAAVGFSSIDRDWHLGRIHEAMVTYSEEGLPVLEPYLTNSDPEIRSAAIEAIKQLAVPVAAPVLRSAAKNASSPQEEIEMLEAADFLELPRLPLDELKKLMEQGSVNSSSLP